MNTALAASAGPAERTADAPADVFPSVAIDGDDEAIAAPWTNFTGSATNVAVDEAEAELWSTDCPTAKTEAANARDADASSVIDWTARSEATDASTAAPSCGTVSVPTMAWPATAWPTRAVVTAYPLDELQDGVQPTKL